MKKYFLGLAAVVFALGAVAFTNPKIVGKDQTTFEFYYQAPGGTDFSDGSVKTLSNWTPSSIDCSGGDVKACNITVQSAYVDTAPNPDVLRTSGSNVLSIQTQASGSVKYVVTTTGVTAIDNKD